MQAGQSLWNPSFQSEFPGSILSISPESPSVAHQKTRACIAILKCNQMFSRSLSHLKQIILLNASQSFFGDMKSIHKCSDQARKVHSTTSLLETGKKQLFLDKKMAGFLFCFVLFIVNVFLLDVCFVRTSVLLCHTG